MTMWTDCIYLEQICVKLFENPIILLESVLVYSFLLQTMVWLLASVISHFSEMYIK